MRVEKPSQGRVFSPCHLACHRNLSARDNAGVITLNTILQQSNMSLISKGLAPDGLLLSRVFIPHLSVHNRTGCGITSRSNER